MLLMWSFCVIAITQAQDNPRVKTSQGWVVGRRADYGDYLEFYGIPYAGPTSGPNRFKPPTSVLKHTEDFQAINRDIICAQIIYPHREILGVEDCLVLSIHTRSLTTAKPVFVWIDGEEYKTTYTNRLSYRSLVMEDLVVVSINYRLSIFGFLCLRVPEAPGNVGLKDVVQGLKWIRDNIAGFGGDPNNIMLVGHGSGAAMVDLITLSPMSKNLVHKAVVLSGSALSPWAVAYEPIQYAKYATSSLIPEVTASKLAEILTNVHIDMLNVFMKFPQFYNASLLFAPCIENYNNPDESFLSKSPIEILRSGDYNHIPYIAGYTNIEGTIRGKECDEWPEIMENNFTDFLQLDLGFYSKENKIAIGNNIREQYFKSEKISTENLDKYLDYHGDVLITIPILRSAHERAKTSKENVRLFEFAYDTKNSDLLFRCLPMNGKIHGAGHGALLNYLFAYDYEYYNGEASNSVVDLFTGFAYFGKPFRSPNKSETWLPVTEESLNKLYISGGEKDGISKYSEQVVQENGTSVLFWEILLDKYYKTPAAPIQINTSAALIQLNTSSASNIMAFTVKSMLLYVFVQIFR